MNIKKMKNGLKTMVEGIKALKDAKALKNSKWFHDEYLDRHYTGQAKVKVGMRAFFLSFVMIIASTCALFAQERVLDNGNSMVTIVDDETDWRNDPEVTIEVVKNLMLTEVNPNFKSNILGPVYDEIAREQLHKMYKQHPEAVDASMDMAESGCLMGMYLYYPEWDTTYIVLLVKCWDGWLIMWRRA